METLRFERPGGSKAIGCLVYLILVIILGVLLGGIGAALAGAGAKELKWPEAAQVAAAVLGGFSVFAFIAWFSYRDFRRRANAAVVIGPESLELIAGPERVEFPYAEIREAWIRFEAWSPTFELVAEEGRRRRLPADIAPFEQVAPALVERLLPKLLARFEAELAAGRSVPLREGSVRAFGRIVYGLFMILASPLLFLSIHHMSRGVAAFRVGVAKIRQGWRGRSGGFSIAADGLLPPGEEARALPWRELTAESIDEHGAVFTSLEGGRLSCSILASNFWAASRLIQDRLK